MIIWFLILPLLGISCHRQCNKEVHISYSKKLSDELEIAQSDLDSLKVHQNQMYNRIQKRQALVFQDLEFLISKKFTVDTIIALLKYTNTNLELTSRQIIDLKLLGVQKNLLMFLLRTSL